MTLRILTLAATLLLPFAARCGAEETEAEAATVAAPAVIAGPAAAAPIETELVQELLPPPPPSGHGLAAVGGRRLQILVQVVDISAPAGQADLGGIRIRAIAPDGSFDEAISDRQGRATVGVQQRPTVLTATGRDLHATMMVYPRRIGTGREPRPVLIPLLHASQSTLLRTIEGLGAAGGAPWEPAESESVPPLTYRIPLTADGTLQGRLVSLYRPASGRRDLSGMNVLILQRGQIVRTVVSDADGRFTVPDLAPGFYGVIASGSAGYGAFGFEAVRPATVLPAPPESASLAPAAETLVSLRQPESAGELGVILAPPQLVPAIAASIAADYPPGPFDAFGELGPGGLPLAPPFGGPGGGFGGGGGGPSGGLLGGGLGGLILPAAIGAGILAAVEDDDEDDFVPPPASPGAP